MPTVQVSEDIKELIERHVAGGVAADEPEFVEAAIRSYADGLAGDDGALLAAAQEGIEASRRGDYVTVSSPEEQESVWSSIWTRAMELAVEMRNERMSVSAEEHR